MSVQASVSGTRLAYVVVPIEGTVERSVHRYSKDKGITVEEEKQPGGFMVYFPRGHVIRLRDKKALAQYKLDKKPRIINLQGLNDPNSAIGQLISSQDEAARQGAMVNLERQVIALATAKTGRVLMPEQVRQVEDDITEGQNGSLVVRPNSNRNKDRKTA